MKQEVVRSPIDAAVIDRMPPAGPFQSTAIAASEFVWGAQRPGRPFDPALRVGIDLVHLRSIEESLAKFGDRFVQRIFTPAEAAYAMSFSALTVERLAARFAAKEAAIKAFRLSETGVTLRDIEVCREPDGLCWLRLHGVVRDVVETHGFKHIALSLSHDGGHAVAIVVAQS